MELGKPFSLESYELFVANPLHERVLSPKIRVDVVIAPDKTEAVLELGAKEKSDIMHGLYAFGEFRMLSLEALDVDEAVLTEPIQLALKVKDKSKSQLTERCAAMAGLAVREGHLNRNSPNFKPGLRVMFDTLYPRHSEPSSDAAEFIFRMNSKVMLNAFGPVGEWNSVLLHCGSYFNHSCLPNVYLRPGPNMTIGFSTYRPVKANRELFISYWNFPIDSKEAREELHRERFTCSCKACRAGSTRHPSVYWAELNSVLPLRPPTHCWFCGESEASLHCVRCKKTRYCSKACRASNAKTHKLICNRIA
jgi:hypothetical protein